MTPIQYLTVSTPRYLLNKTQSGSLKHSRFVAIFHCSRPLLRCELIWRNSFTTLKPRIYRVWNKFTPTNDQFRVPSLTKKSERSRSSRRGRPAALLKLTCMLYSLNRRGFTIGLQASEQKYCWFVMRFNAVLLAYRVGWLVNIAFLRCS